MFQASGGEFRSGLRWCGDPPKLLTPAISPIHPFESIVLKENSGSHRKDEDKGIITHTLLSYDEYYILATILY